MDHFNSTQVSNESDFSSIFTDQVLSSFYCIIFVVGVPLNVVAAWILFRVPGDSGLVVYLKNMVVADLLMLSTLPFKVVDKLGFGTWHLRMITCRYTAALFYLCMYVGIVFMGVISLNRYVKVVHHSSSSTSSCTFIFGRVSLLQLLQSSRIAQVLAFFIWGLVFVIALPNVILTSKLTTEQISKDCMELKTMLGIQWHHWSIFLSMSLFWLTLFFLVFCYVSIACQVCKSYRQVHRVSSDIRHKSSRNIFSILVVFFICFVPYHVCCVPYTLSQMPALGFSRNTHFLLFQLKEGTIFLSTLNVCLDPIIYLLMCQTFRESLLRKLSRRLPTKSQSLNIIDRETTDKTQDK